MSRWWIGAVIVAAACQDISAIRDRVKIDIFQQAPTDQVDILWVIDNSNSMQLEQNLLSAGFTSFAEELENTATNFHLGVITTDFDYDDSDRGRLVGEPAFLTSDDDYESLFEERVRVGLNGSGKEKGLEAAAYALSPSMTIGLNRGFLRDEANLLVVFVSDEDDCSDEGALGTADNTSCYSQRDKLVPVADYVDAFTDLKADRSQVQVGAIVGPDDATALCDDSTLPGRRYIELARLTGGLSGSICETEWSTFLYDLGLNAAGIFTTFELEHGAKPDSIEVTVDGAFVPESGENGYTYDSTARSITFHGVAIPPRGAEIKVTYTIEPGT